MGFDSGSVSVRAFYLPEALNPSVVEAFARHAAPPISTLDREPLYGWVSGRHLLDRDLSEENCLIGGYLYVTLMKAERKIPEALLRAHCRLEEQAEMQARGAVALPRAVRSEIKAGVIEQLMPAMPPTLTGIPVVIDFSTQTLYASAMSDKQIDLLVQHMRETVGSVPVPMTPETSALKRKQLNFRDLDISCFAPNPDDVPGVSDALGHDFLTWLWYFWEREGGNLHVDGSDPFGVMLEGPLMFVMEGDGAHETVLRKGMPLLSAEAKAALEGGKKLKRAKLTLARGEELWVTTLDATDFGFRGLKMPKGDSQLDPISRFQERMLALDVFMRAFATLFDEFLDARRDARRWRETVEGMRAWIRDRRTQA